MAKPEGLGPSQEEMGGSSKETSEGKPNEELVQELREAKEKELGALSKRELESQKSWSPESAGFFVGIGTEGKAEDAEGYDKVDWPVDETTGEGYTWEPEKYEETIDGYAKERGIEDNLVAQASFLLAVKEDRVTDQGIYANALKHMGPNLMFGIRDLAKEGGDATKAWQYVKLNWKVQEKLKHIRPKEEEKET